MAKGKGEQNQQEPKLDGENSTLAKPQQQSIDLCVFPTFLWLHFEVFSRSWKEGMDLS